MCCLVEGLGLGLDFFSIFLARLFMGWQWCHSVYNSTRSHIGGTLCYGSKRCSSVAQWLGRRSLDWQTFPDMRPIYGWRVTSSWVRRPLWVNQPSQLSLLPSVGWGMSSISVAKWVKLFAAVSPSSECLYEGKADVVRRWLCVIHIWALSGRVTDDRHYTSPLPFLSYNVVNLHVLTNCCEWSYAAVKTHTLQFKIASCD